MPPTHDDWKRILSNWGRQTIALAMSQRAMDLQKGLDDETRARSAGVEANDVAQRLWAEAFAAAGDPPDPPRFQAEFVKRIFAWSFDHLDAKLG